MYDLSKNVHRITLYNTIAKAHQHPSNIKRRLYLHMDMNCFYAQVEQQCYNLYGIPVIVGGWRKGNGVMRGIVATSSYEARVYGIKTGVSAYEAVNMCPYVVPLQVHYEKYQSISREIRDILSEFSPTIEGYSMDEYFLDLSFFRDWDRARLEDIGNRVKNKIYAETGLVCSVGISYSKTYAKLSSDLIKPNGLVLVLDEDDARRLIYPLGIGEVWGVGRKRTPKLIAEGVVTIQDAVDRGSYPFRKLFGEYFGQMLYDSVTGKDCGKVMDETEPHQPKEISYMHTFSDCTDEPARVKGEFAKAIRQLAYRMRGYGAKAEHFSGYIRFQDVHWNGISFHFLTDGFTNVDDYILEACLRRGMPYVIQFLKEGHRIRGIGLNTISMSTQDQLQLFFMEDEKKSKLAFAVDAINNKFGLNTLISASSMHSVEGNTHFLER